MAYVLRWVNLILILAFWILALVATCPVDWFRLKMDGLYDQSGSVRVSLWEFRDDGVTMTVPATGQVEHSYDIPKVRSNYLNCTTTRGKFRAMQGFSIASTVLGFYSFLLCLLMCACCLKVKLPLFIFLILAFICEIGAIASAALLYTQDSCKDKTNYFPALKTTGYSIGIGFILSIIACVGFLVCVIITPFTQVLWCGNW